MSNRRPKQTLRVLDYMQRFGSITQREASNKLAVDRLPARIWELKKDGHIIRMEKIKVKNRFGEYSSVACYRLGDDAQNG